MKYNKILLAVSLFGLVAISSSCDKETDKEDKVIAPEYTKDEYPFTTIYKNSGSFVFSPYNELFPNANEKLTYHINKSIGTSNYLKLEFETDSNMVGWISYCDEADSSKTYEEKIFVKAGDTKFTTFLDNYRDGAYGKFASKKILDISFRSVDSTKFANFTFKSLSHSNRKVHEGRMFIDDGTIKLGTSVRFGGAIEWLERIDINIIEYLDSGRNVRIDKDIDPSTIESNKLISSEVNMINIYDYGREIQPSYYLQVDKDNNGYDPKTLYNYDSIEGKPKYNPILCGGVGDPNTGLRVGAQIVDYEYKEDHIYFKTKGQDWMFVNDQAQGYIEVNYHFGEDGVLVVDNTYTDFYGFAGLNSTRNPMSGQETPATYFVYPLNYFYCKTKQRTINDPFLGPQGKSGVIAVESPTAATPSAGNYFYGLKSSSLYNRCDWAAFVNDQGFGAGIYMPNSDYIMASRGNVSNKYSDNANHSYLNHFYNFGNDLVPSYAASNYNYINPQIRRRMVEYIPLKYSYALFIGDVEEMDEAFAKAKENGLTNEELVMSEGSWPRV